MIQMTCKFTTTSSLPLSSSSSVSLLSSFKSSNGFSSSSTINHTFPSTGGTCTLTWDDVLHIFESKHVTEQEEDPCSYLQGFFHKVQLCNRGSMSTTYLCLSGFKDKQSEFLPFFIEGHIVGFIHNRFVEHLRGFNHVFVFTKHGISLHPLLKTADERTSAVVMQ
ncbi:hypothetical protein P8452_14800 [Trifolium repens]|nr:hypothetical protein P8452_14800 [Trifolium repens]